MITVESMVFLIVTINCPLHPETENLFDDAMISKMKKVLRYFLQLEVKFVIVMLLQKLLRAVN